jgi:carbamoyl-phosphate synthase small subunit
LRAFGYFCPSRFRNSVNTARLSSVQYHPEAAAGPHDSRYLFDHFLELMEKH